jgi:hypothetical protein
MKTFSKIYLAFVVIFSFLIGCNFMILTSGAEFTTHSLFAIILDVVMLICNISWFKRSLNE